MTVILQLMKTCHLFCIKQRQDLIWILYPTVVN